MVLSLRVISCFFVIFLHGQIAHSRSRLLLRRCCCLLDLEVAQHPLLLSLVENVALLIIDCLRYSEGDLVLALGVNNILFESLEHAVGKVIDEEILVSIHSQQVCFIRVDFEVQKLHGLIDG
jgi:hypothetical protein